MDKRETSLDAAQPFNTTLDMLKRVLAVAEIVAKSMPPTPSAPPKKDEKSRKG
jgi:hypothetical protein